MKSFDHVRSNAVGYVALFVALGGTAYAAGLPANSVGTSQIKRGAVTRVKIGSNSVTGTKVANGSLTGADIKDGSLTGSDIRTSTLGLVPRSAHSTTSDQLGGVAASSYLTSSTAIPGGDLNGTYSDPTIAPGAVTGSKVARDSLTGANIDESTLSGIGAGVMAGRLNALSTNIVNGGPPTGNSTGTSAVITTYQDTSPSIATVARDFSFQLTVAPGNGASRQMQFVVGTGVTPVCTISGSATTCTGRGPVSLPANAQYSVQEIPSGSPATADLAFGYRLTTP